MWENKVEITEEQEQNADAIMREILSHSKSGISVEELRKRVENPEEYAEPDAVLDKIEVVE